MTRPRKVRLSSKSISRVAEVATVVAICLLTPGCGNRAAVETSTPLHESARAKDVVESLQAQYHFTSVAPSIGGGPQRTTELPVLSPPEISQFLQKGPHVVPMRGPGTVSFAAVTFGSRSTDDIVLQDLKSGLTISAHLRDAVDVRPELGSGYLVYLNAFPNGGKILRKAQFSGSEDFITYEVAPASADLVYKIKLGTGVAGIRHVSNTLEFLDSGGAPRLRIDPPFIVGADNNRVEARLALEG